MKNTRGKREAILEAAFEVVTVKGYFETTVDDICRKAGVAKGTVYLYFKDKADVYLGLVDWLLCRALDIIAEVDARPLSPREKLAEVFNAWSENVFSRPGVLSMLSMDSSSIPSQALGRFRQTIVPRIRQMTDAVVGIVRPGIASGEFRKVDASLAGLAFLQAFRTGILAAQLNVGPQPGHRTVFDLFLSGLLSRPSRKTKTR